MRLFPEWVRMRVRQITFFHQYVASLMSWPSYSQTRVCHVAAELHGHWYFFYLPMPICIHFCTYDSVTHRLSTAFGIYPLRLKRRLVRPCAWSLPFLTSRVPDQSGQCNTSLYTSEHVDVIARTCEISLTSNKPEFNLSWHRTCGLPCTWPI